jgi:Tfp pilus assembly protein PilF
MMKLRFPAPIVPIIGLSLLCLFSLLGQAQVPPGLTENTATGWGGGHRITGTVLLPSGNPPSERIRIRLMGSRAEVSTMTDEAGRFLISGLTDGGYTVYVEPPEKYQPQSENIELSSTRAGGQTYSLQFRLRESTRTDMKPGVVSADLADVPRRAVEFFEKAGARSAANDAKGAVDLLLKAVAEHPAFFLAHSELGVQYQKLNELDKADHHLQAALKIKPDAYGPLANRGVVLVRLRKYVDAEPVLRSAIKIKNDSPVVDFYLGRALLGQKRPNDAEPVFRSAFEKGGSDMIEARRALATIYLERGENEKAVVEIEAYLVGNPTAYDARQLQETVTKIKEWLKANAKP